METSANASAFSHTEQSVAQELSLKQISQILLNNWLLFLVLFLTFSTTAVLVYSYKVPYVAQSSIGINDNQNSSLQSFATQYFGLTKSVNDGKKANSPLLKHLEYLKTSDFFEILLSRLQSEAEHKSLTLAEKEGYQNFKKQFTVDEKNEVEKIKTLSALESMARIKLDSDFELKVSFVSDSKETALYLTNTALRSTLQLLKQRELSEILKVEGFIQEQMGLAEKNMAQYNKQLAEFQNKPENLISLSSKEKVGEYISDLMVRKNELKMKIAENKKMIDYLSQGSKGIRESQLYGNGGRVQALKLENQMHESNLNQIQASVDRVTNMAKAIPVAGQIYEDLRKKSEIEFQKYKNLNEALSKAEVQKLSVESRFEILETARLDKVKPQINLITLLLIAFVLSQMMGCLIIYITSIWDSTHITAQSSRNVVILDGHSLDPRIIIEDSKIRFRLKNTNFEEGTGLEDEMISKKLTFRLFNQKSVNGEDVP